MSSYRCTWLQAITGQGQRSADARAVRRGKTRNLDPRCRRAQQDASSSLVRDAIVHAKLTSQLVSLHATHSWPAPTSGIWSNASSAAACTARTGTPNRQGEQRLDRHRHRCRVHANSSGRNSPACLPEVALVPIWAQPDALLSVGHGLCRLGQRQQRRAAVAAALGWGCSQGPAAFDHAMLAADS